MGLGCTWDSSRSPTAKRDSAYGLRSSPPRAHAAIVADYQEGMQRAGSLPMLMQQFFCFVCRSLEEYMEHSEIAEECR